MSKEDLRGVITPGEEAALDAADFATAVLEDGGLPAAADAGGPAGGRLADEPLMSDPAWPEFVLRHFAEDELNANGQPLVHGLRRVARLLLGPVLYSGADAVQCPSFAPDFERSSLLQPAVVAYTVRLLMCRLEQGLHQAYEVTFKDVADCYFGNTDPDYARHASATAATKAEARCLRKALQLRGVASEEVTAVAAPDASVDGYVTPAQVNFINVLCRRNKLNVVKFINMGGKTYPGIEDVPYGTAAAMVEYLSGLQNDPARVPESIRGYDPNWQRRAA